MSAVFPLDLKAFGQFFGWLMPLNRGFLDLVASFAGAAPAPGPFPFAISFPFCELSGSGPPARTGNLQVMGLVSCQFLQPAIEKDRCLFRCAATPKSIKHVNSCNHLLAGLKCGICLSARSFIGLSLSHMTFSSILGSLRLVVPFLVWDTP